MTPNLKASSTLAGKIVRAIQGRAIRNDLKTLIAVASFDAALEHHRAIILTVKNNLVGSSFTLLRPMFDSCMVGLWAAHVADDNQIYEFNRRHHYPKPDKVLKALKGKTTSRYLTVLQTIYDSGHGVLDEFVHGGLSMVSRRTDGKNVGACFPNEMISELLHVSNVIAAICATQLADWTNDRRSADGLIAAIDSYFEKRA
jgi:hypothetical protein